MEILEKNLALLEKTNKILADKIRNVSEIKNSYELKTNLAGEYNLAVNGKLVHSVNGAEKEAEMLFKQLPNESANVIHVIYGLGLGYMLDYYFEHTKGSIIVYEPDIELLRIVLEIVDFEKQLSAPNVFVASTRDELKMAYDLLFRYKTETDVSYLDYYKYNKKDEYDKFMKDFNTIHSIYAFNHKFHAETTYLFLHSTLYAMYKRLFLPEIDSYKNILKDKPAVIVSAGPSLAKNIETLKKAKNHVVIFCVGAAYKTLYENGITPDFAVLIEKFNTSHHYTFPNNKDVTMIIEPFTNYSVFQADFKRYITSVSYETSSNHWFKKIKNETIGDFEAKGTVSYQALSAAKLMGCNPLILLGQDLAYVDGKCYAKGSQFEDLECIKDETTGEYKVWPKNYEKFRDAYCSTLRGKYSDEILDDVVSRNMEKIMKGLTFVDDQKGGKLPTQSGYSMFIQYFQEFAQKNNGENILINSSTGGANIKGFSNIPLSEAIAPYLEKEIDVENIISQVQPDLPDKSVVEKNLRNDMECIREILPLLSQGQSFVKIINMEHQRHKKSTQIALNSLKKAVELYLSITNTYYINSVLYRLIATQENSSIKWFLKENIDMSEFGEQKEALELFKNYYFNVEKKCKRIIYLIEKNLEVLDESCLAKS